MSHRKRQEGRGARASLYFPQGISGADAISAVKRTAKAWKEKGGMKGGM